jgi:hypothetical protein
LAKGDRPKPRPPDNKAVRISVKDQNDNLVNDATCIIAVGPIQYSGVTNENGVAFVVIPYNLAEGLIRITKDGYGTYEDEYSLPLTPLIQLHITVSSTPPPPDVIPLPDTHPLFWRGDFLTLYTSNQNFTGHFLMLSDTEQNEVIRLMKERNYTDILLETIHKGSSQYDPMPAYDLLRNGNDNIIRFGLEKLRQNGIRAVIQFGFSNNKASWNSYKPISNYGNNYVVPFLKKFKSLINSISFGIEITETWTWDEIHELARIVSQECPDIPMAFHMGQGEWGPNRDNPWEGGREEAWWTYLKDIIPNDLGMFFQYVHKDSNTQFICTDYEIIQHTEALLDGRLRRVGVYLIAGEYGFRVPEEQTRRAGAIAKQYGADGFMNGGL